MYDIVQTARRTAGYLHLCTDPTRSPRLSHHYTYSDRMSGDSRTAREKRSSDFYFRLRLFRSLHDKTRQMFKRRFYACYDRGSYHFFLPCEAKIVPDGALL